MIVSLPSVLSNTRLKIPGAKPSGTVMLRVLLVVEITACSPPTEADVTLCMRFPTNCIWLELAESAATFTREAILGPPKGTGAGSTSSPNGVRLEPASAVYSTVADQAYLLRLAGAH